MRHLTTFRTIDAIVRTGSIRSAADLLSQTPSAVQRRLQGYEDELGHAIFERTSRGVRLNAAGELVIHHIRETLTETDRLTSRIADLAGLRRGHVSVGCSQALAADFLVKEISRFQADHPHVTFNVDVIGHTMLAERLNDFSLDLGIVFDESSAPDYEVLLGVPQMMMAVMSADHPLAQFEMLRLRQCCDYGLLLPTRGFGGRFLIDKAMAGKPYAVAPSLESNSFEFLMAHVRHNDSITFQIEAGVPPRMENRGLVGRPIDPQDVFGGTLYVGKKPYRTLSVAASLFIERVVKDLSNAIEPAA